MHHIHRHKAQASPVWEATLRNHLVLYFIQVSSLFPVQKTAYHTTSVTGKQTNAGRNNCRVGRLIAAMYMYHLLC